MSFLSGRWSRRALAALMLLAVLLGLYLARAELLPPVARFLDVSEPPVVVDDVMVLGGGSDTRPFIAAALVKSGKARQVLIPTVKLVAQCRAGYRSARIRGNPPGLAGSWRAANGHRATARRGGQHRRRGAVPGPVPGSQPGAHGSGRHQYLSHAPGAVDFSANAGRTGRTSPLCGRTNRWLRRE